MVGMIYERRHTRAIKDFGGLAKVVPVFSTLLLVVSLSSIGLPGLNGFVGEFLILLGSFGSMTISPWFAILGATGVIFAAVYLLWMYQRVIFGPVTNSANQGLSDMNARELTLLLPVIFFIVWIGVYPGTFLGLSASKSKEIVTMFVPGGGAGQPVTQAPAPGSR
jgi:NADH-quinone oxidoreductase subunit M